MRKNYIGICLDKSGSMQSLRRATVKAYNENIKAIRDATQREKQDTILFSNAFGGDVRWLFRNSSINILNELTETDYRPDGGTPLFKALVEMIEQLKQTPDYNDPNVAFQILVVSDGEENSSGPNAISQAKRLMSELNATDRWTFAFLLPRGSARDFIRKYDVAEGNIREWDQTERGTVEAFHVTTQAYDNYFSLRSAGKTATKTFYTNLAGVTPGALRVVCRDIRDEVSLFEVGPREEVIRELCEARTNKPFLKGAGFYELVKSEKKVQANKQIIIRSRLTGEMFAGEAARQTLGLPIRGDVKLVPGAQGQFDVFIQSTSVNRKLPPMTRVLYWPKVGVPYIEGVSSPWSR